MEEAWEEFLVVVVQVIMAVVDLHMVEVLVAVEVGGVGLLRIEVLEMLARDLDLLMVRVSGILEVPRVVEGVEGMVEASLALKVML